MKTNIQKITPFLWFNDQAEEAEATGRSGGTAITKNEVAGL
jgi:hypothetical protein